ncbi:MAG: RNA polymerase sigma factor [Prosthecobacter sp.]
METDLHLLTRYRRHGDAEAFQSLVEAHAGMVYSTASRVTRDTTLAQDVAQETFLALARSGGSAIRSVGAWLHHVAWQKARDMVRGESRRRNHEAAAAKHINDLRTEATWEELEPRLDEAIEELSEQAKSVLVARFFGGLSQQEIAERQGISQSTVSRALDQGIAELRSKLKVRGIACSAGLAALLATHGVQAAPPALVTTLGKLALSGLGAATATLTSTQIITSILMTPVAKLSLAAVAVLAIAAIGNDLATSNPTTRSLFADSSPPLTTPRTNPPAPGKGGSANRPSAAPPSSGPGASAAPLSKASQASAMAPGGTVNGPSPVMLARLSTLKTQADFKALVLRLFATKDPRQISAELKRLIGIDVDEAEVARRLIHPNVLENAIITEMATRHPEEMLAWLSLFEGTTNMMSMVAYPLILKNHPHITAGSIAATLPAGPHHEQVLGLLRAQRDPLTEAALLIRSNQDPAMRQNHLWELANLWPKEKAGEGVAWALQNLSGRDLDGFLPELTQQLSYVAPDQAISLLGQITDPDLLARTLVESFNGLVGKHPRVADVLPLIDRLDGPQRVYAISNLTSQWVRVDQEGLMQWMNSIENPADFETALPLTLPQLSDRNYQRAIATLMTQLDARLEAALIKSAMPNRPQSTRTITDIIQRLTALPQYQQIGSGQTGNQDLLWQAVNQNAAGWVSKQGARPQDGAQWIDSLPFRTPADKAIVAGKLYEQWKLSDPSSAAQWAARAGVSGH